MDGEIVASCAVAFSIDQPRFSADIERREESAAHPQPARKPQLATVREIEVVRAPGKDAGESLLLVADLLPERIGERGAASAETAGAAVRRFGDADLGQLV